MLYTYGVTLPDWETLDKLLSRTKGRLFFNNHVSSPFLGALLCEHKIKWDETIPTANCNGSTIRWNPYFFYWLSPDERVTVLAHELWHSAYDHPKRFKDLGDDAQHKKCNIAADHVINLSLNDARYVFGEKLTALGLYMDPQYAGMSTEEVYNLLPDPPSGGGSTGNPAPGSSGSGGDIPSEFSGDIQEPENGETDADRMGRIVRAKQVAEQCNSGNMAGVIPGEIEQLIDEFLNPIIPWEILLHRYFTDLSNDDYSWRRPSRRHEDEYLPSLMGESGLEHLIYFLDISGSISDNDIVRFNSEVKYIHEELQPERLTLMTFDTKIQDVYEFERDMPFDKITVIGRGGTDLNPVHEKIRELQPTAAVIFSDLYVREIPEDPGSPVLWVVIGNDDAEVPYGTKIHINDE